jgi:hypothetical protein
MQQGQLNWVANFIWGIADDVLRDLYVRGKYRDVILPMTVLRRLDAVLEPTKQAVLDMKASLDKAGITNQDQALRQAAGQAFYNASKFTLRDLKARASQQQLKADFEAYLDGFSPNVQDNRQLDAQRKLRHWYWASVFTNRYSGSVESTSARDFLDLKNWFDNDAAEPALIGEFKTRFRSLELRRESACSRDDRRSERRHRALQAVHGQRGLQAVVDGYSVRNHVREAKRMTACSKRTLSRQRVAPPSARIVTS